MNRTPKDQDSPPRSGADLGQVRNLAEAALAGLSAAPQVLLRLVSGERDNTAREHRAIADRLAKATQQLAAEELDTRLGAIEALERIARDSERDHIPVIEALCAFIRRNAPASEARDHRLGDWEPLPDEASEADRAVHLARRRQRFAHRFSSSLAWTWAQTLDAPRADIQAALEAIGRRPHERILHERRQRKSNIGEGRGYHLDLRGVSLQRADLAGLNLSRAVLTGSRLEGADLGKVRLDEADLRQARLDGADLRQARLEGANLEQARLEGANLRQAQLEGAILWEAHLEGADLRLANLEGANLQQAHLEVADLRMARLEVADLGRARLEGADLRLARLLRADLRLAHLEGAHLCHAHLERAHLRLAWLKGADLRQTHFDGADLAKARLHGAEMERAQLAGANLRGARLNRAHLGEARLDRAALGGAHLEGAELSHTRLDGANLRRAHLNGTGLHAASLKGANLSDWNCERASLRSADFTDATGLTQDHVDAAFGDSGTVLPEGIARPDHWDAETVPPGQPDPKYQSWRAGVPSLKPASTPREA